MTNKIDKIQMPDGQVLKLNGGSGLEVCDIGTALYIDETKGLRRYLNGSIVDINTNTQAFLNRLLEIKNTNPDYFTTEANWQSEALLNIDGCVYKFVLNYASDGETVVSVRLPKYPDYVEINAGGTLPVVGNGISLGLTDGSNNYGLYGEVSVNRLIAYSDSYGQNIKPSGGSAGLSPASTAVLGITTDPTKSGIQTTLKQTKLKMRYFIQIATGSETEANIVNTLENVNGFTLLENKYSDKPLYNESWLLSNGQYNPKATYPTAYEGLQVEYNTEIEAGTTVTLPSGVSYTKRGLSVKLSTETYTDYDFVLNTADETFRLPLLDGSENLPSQKFDNLTLTSSDSIYIAPANGRYYLKMSANTGQFINMHRINASGDDIIISHDVSVNNLDVFTEIEVKKGDKVRITHNTSGNVLAFKFIYAQGNGTLYYYVGDIDQNHGIVNMGRIGEILPTKTDKVQAGRASMPSDKYIDITIGASGATYTMPADGYLAFYGNTPNTSEGGSSGMRNLTLGNFAVDSLNIWGRRSACIMPVRKNDQVEIYFTNAVSIRLYPLQGNKGEL